MILDVKTEAKEFAKEYLLNYETYDVVRIELGYSKQLLDRINY